MNKKIIKSKKLITLDNKYEGKWVALSVDYKKVIAYSDSLKSLTNKIGKQKAVITKGLAPDMNYAFLCRG